MMTVLWGIMLPFLGTTVGAACVFFLRGEMNRKIRSALSGFAGGIMVAASVWSLLIPAIERSASLGSWAFLPATLGLLVGIVLLQMTDVWLPTVCSGEQTAKKRTDRMMLAVTLHNLPEGMAVGAAFAGVLAGERGIGIATAIVLAMGVAIQNVPEGAIVSMPLHCIGYSRLRAFIGGVLSGVIEPIGAILTVLATGFVVPILPILLGFAAGAMLYVVVAELIPEIGESGHVRVGNLCFGIGFAVMMVLDVVLG